MKTRHLAATSCLGLLIGCGPQALSPDQLPSTEAQALTSCPGSSVVSGIDISNNQGFNFDLAGQKANGVRFVYLKASEGDFFTDDTYAGYRRKAESLGLVHGAYHFFHPEQDPTAQADLFLKVIGSAPAGDLPPALDWELVNGIPWAEAFSRARTFLDRVKSATGRTPIIYTSSDFFGATPPSDFADYPLWVANYGPSGLEGPTCPTVPAPWDHWTIYQWTSSGGSLDRDRFDGDLAALRGFAGSGSARAASSASAPPVRSCVNAVAGAEPVLSGCNAAAIDAVAPASAKAFLNRAYKWIDEGVMYSQHATHDDYRTDCSGFVSYVWQLQPAGMGCPWTEDFAGGYDDLHESVRIDWDQLTPGDALNDPVDHIMLWGGWLDKAHTQICTMEEFYPGEPARFMTHNIHEAWPVDIRSGFLPIRKAGYVPSTTTCETLAAPLDQVENNGGLSAMSWSDGHVELFARTKSGRALHVWTAGASDAWRQAEEFPGKAECGVASVMSYAGEEHAELFDPDPKGATQKLYYLKGWHDFEGFGGEGVTQLSTLRWSDLATGGSNDGRTEVFGLGEDHRLHHKYYDPRIAGWSGWESLGGHFATGASAILSKDGRGLLFATDRDGQVWVDESRRSTGDGWKGWEPLGGQLSSRPVVVREANGTLRLFGRGLDGKLYGTRSTQAGYAPFEPIDGDYQISGEPSAAIDDGRVELFVRGTKGKVAVSTLDSKAHRFSPLAERASGTFASDPFAWQRPDGRVELFAVTTAGHLMASFHAKTGWTQWKRLATGVDACPAPQVGCPDGNGDYCGGHGVGGAPGTLYSCNDGKLTLSQKCAASCQEQGKGGADLCAEPSACNTNADCVASLGPEAVCVTPALFCQYPETDVANYCSLDVQSTLEQPCSQESDCDPGHTGTMVCGACLGSCGAAHCCDFAS